LLATAPENLTVANINTLLDAISRSVNSDPSKTLGQLLS
jgi:predicted transcriptional regulator with HTH domain